VSVVNSLINSDEDDEKYVLKTLYDSQVGNIEDLVFSSEENTTIIDEINSINQRLT